MSDGVGYGDAGEQEGRLVFEGGYVSCEHSVLMVG